MTDRGRGHPRSRPGGARSAGSSARRSPACSCARSSTSRRTGGRRRSRRPSTRRSTCWRSDSASARSSPRSAASATSSSSAPARSRRRCLFASVFPGDVRDVRQVPVPAHLRRDPGRAGRHRGARHRRGALDRDAHRRLRLRAAAGRDGVRARPELGHAGRPVHLLRSRAYGWACFGITIAAFLKSIDNFGYVTSAVITPLFLVAGTFFPIEGLPRWAEIAAQFNPLYHCVELVRHAVFGFEGWDRRVPRRRPDRRSAWGCGGSRSTAWSAS